MIPSGRAPSAIASHALQDELDRASPGGRRAALLDDLAENLLPMRNSITMYGRAAGHAAERPMTRRGVAPLRRPHGRAGPRAWKPRRRSRRRRAPSGSISLIATRWFKSDVGAPARRSPMPPEADDALDRGISRRAGLQA